MRPATPPTTLTITINNIDKLNEVGLYRLGCLLYEGHFDALSVDVDKENGYRFLALSAKKGYYPAQEFLLRIAMVTPASSDAKQEVSAASLLSAAWGQRASSTPPAEPSEPPTPPAQVSVLDDDGSLYGSDDENAPIKNQQLS